MTQQKQQKWFTKEFEEEAVRLVGASGRNQREIAQDLGIGLSTLVRWLSRSRDRQAASFDRRPEADTAAELKRLRRENEILRREGDILERAVVGSPGQRDGLGERSGWCFAAEGFSRPGVEWPSNCVEIILAVHGWIRSPGQALP